MLKVNLKHVAAQKGVTKLFTHLRKNGFSHYKAHALTAGTVTYLDLRDLEKICLLFRCMPEDILEWVNGISGKRDESQPLNKLANKGVPVHVVQLLAQMDKEEVEKWVEDLKSRGKGDEKD